MDYQKIEEIEPQRSEQSYIPESKPKQSPNNMATASMVMGILAVTLCCCIYTVFLFGGLGIIFACLSRTEKEMRGQAKAGLILSIVAFVLMIMLYACLFAVAINYGEPSPIRNMPVIPSLPLETGVWDNILTIFGVFR